MVLAPIAYQKVLQRLVFALRADQQKRWFKEEAGEALVMAGYEKDLNW